jgi:energy-coupling factor transporter transmembrane protein EcfT
MSTWQAINTWVTFGVAIVVVIVLAVTLILTLAALRAARGDATKLAGGLEAVVANTDSVPEQLTAINGALVQLLVGLQSVDGHLAGAARAFGLR